jgi:hypothetical protein
MLLIHYKYEMLFNPTVSVLTLCAPWPKCIPHGCVLHAQTQLQWRSGAHTRECCLKCSPNPNPIPNAKNNVKRLISFISYAIATLTPQPIPCQVLTPNLGATLPITLHVAAALEKMVNAVETTDHRPCPCTLDTQMHAYARNMRTHAHALPHTDYAPMASPSILFLTPDRLETPHERS